MSPQPPCTVPLFAGQGTDSINSLQTRQQALRDAESPSGSLLLSSCFEAFQNECSTLSLQDLENMDISPRDFSDPKSLLTPSRRYAHNPIASGITLLLVQSLRYLVFTEQTTLHAVSIPSFSLALSSNDAFGIGILGFSSGIIPASIVGTSVDKLTYICRSVEAFKLVFWIGVRSLQRRKILMANSGYQANGVDTLCWSIVCFGISAIHAREHIDEFEQHHDLTSALDITAILSVTHITISGRPDILEGFSKKISHLCTVHWANVDTLYHSPKNVCVRRKVLADVAARRIHFPNFSDLRYRVRSTFTGNLIDRHEKSGSLVETVLDMVLIHPVKWNLVIENILDAFPLDVPLHLVNVGPGVGLSHSLKRSFRTDNLSVHDLTIVDANRNEEIGRPVPPSKQEPIAIIGMSVNMPGAPDVHKLWNILEQGVNTISGIPECRFKVQDYLGAKSPANSRTMLAHTGNFIDKPEEFDYKFFKISPREARSMDPQQRLLLHVAYEALENAGYVPDATPSFQRNTFGCYIGAATHDYVENLRGDIDVYYSTGTLQAFLSGRISYTMQLSGPSMVVDTACSSSAVAIYQACRALANEDCNAALAGGVNVITSPDMFLGLDRGHFLSPTGSSKAFDASADGYSRGEGLGLFVLKRLSDAIAENDNILGIIRGIEINQSGTAESITHPHVATQTALFQKLMQNSNVLPSRVSVVEAHGTGTQAGDPAELQSIRSVFARGRSTDNPLHVTSIKANIGHLEAASGAAGLAKLLLMFQHGAIPPQISFSTLNPKIAPLELDNTLINTSLKPWSPPVLLPRIAMLNNFGAAGSNAALLLEEHITQVASEIQGMKYIFGISAKSLASLEELRSGYLGWLRNANGDVRISDLVYTATARRQVYDYRIAVTASSQRELIEKLSNAKPVEVMKTQGGVIFIFSGQGSQYLGMGASLYLTCPLFKRCIDQCHSFLLANGFPGVVQIITNNVSPGGDISGAFQTAIIALEYALAKLWMQWGLLPAAVAGHSLGEYSALVIAGVLSIEDALTIVAQRARLMWQKCKAIDTGMLAVTMSYDDLEGILSSAFPDVTVSCVNTARDCVVSGPTSSLVALEAHLNNHPHECRLLDVPFGYHSATMQPILDDLRGIVSGVKINPPSIPVVSNVLGDIVPAGSTSVFNAEYFVRHCRDPVLFYQGLRALRAHVAHTSVWIEIGPHAPCLPMIRSSFTEQNHTIFIPSLRRGCDSWAVLTNSLSKLYLSNIPLLWREVYSHLPSVSCIDLPSYPFVKSRFWITYKEPHKSLPTLSTLAHTGRSSSALLPVEEYSMLHSWIQCPAASNGNVAIFKTPIDILARYIQGHKVIGYALCPASLYLEQVFAGIEVTRKYLEMDPSSIPVLQNIQFASPLVYRDQVSLVVKITIGLTEGGTGMFTVTSTSESSSDESTHVRGVITLRSTSETSGQFACDYPLLSRCAEAIENPAEERLPERFSTRTAYEVVFPRVVDYSAEYRTIQSLTVSADGFGLALMKLPSDYHRGTYVVHPTFIDTLLHIAGFMANIQGGINEAYICSDVSSVEVLSGFIDYQRPYLVYCTSSWASEKDVMHADAYAIQVTEPKRLVAHVKGMQFRRVGISGFKRGLSVAAGEVEATRTRRRTDSNPLLSPLSLDFDLSRPRSNTYSPTTNNDNPAVITGSCWSNSHVRTDGQYQSLHPKGMTKHLPASSDHLIVGYPSSPNGMSSSTRSSPRTLVSSEEEHIIQAFATTQFNIKCILASVLDLDPDEVKDDANLHALGLDSLTSIEAIQAFKVEFGLNLPHNLFRNHFTIHSLHAYFLEIDYDTPTGEMTETPRFGLQFDCMPTLLQRSDDNTHLPLFLVHDGSGLIHHYSRLSQLGRNVWGLHNPRFCTAEPWESLESMAFEYAQRIVRMANGPILLGGWSFGGVLAFEMANQLINLGITVKGVLLLDAPSPLNHVPLSNAILDFVTNIDPQSEGNAVARLIKAQFRMNSETLERYTPNFDKYPSLALLRSEAGFKPVGIPDVPTWLANRGSPHCSISAGWQAIVGAPIKTWDIPGNHFEPFHYTNIEHLSLQVDRACSYLECL